MKKAINPIPFDSNKMPPKQNIFLVPIIWLGCWLMTRKGRLKIHKTRMKGLKPPFLVIGTHLAFMDFYVTPLALFPYRANYVSELESFEAYGEWLYRQIGCLGTRKYVRDVALVKNIKRVIDKKRVLVLYPEARYANIGTNSKLPLSVGKLAKFLKVPVVVINMRGNYLQSPIWNLKTRKGVRLEADVEQVFTQEELARATLTEIQSTLQERLSYDEYRWQYAQNMKIDYKNRAEGLELVLYQCPECLSEFQMSAEGTDIFCLHCQSRWHMTELGRLEQVQRNEEEVRKAKIWHIPDWYEWQRSQVMEEIDAGKYHLTLPVQIDSLPNAKNFIDLGQGVLKHNQHGFSLTFIPYGEKEEKTCFFHPLSTLSVHTEYNYRRKGQCITLSELDNTYFLFPKGAGFNVTKIQFATEYLYESAIMTDTRPSNGFASRKDQQR